jgi:hypothetical protein
MQLKFLRNVFHKYDIPVRYAPDYVSKSGSGTARNIMAEIKIIG